MRFYFLILLIIVLPTTSKSNTQNPCMVVFIHGAVKGQWARCSLPNVMRDCVEKSVYQKAVSTIRNDPFFYYAHAMQDMGLKKITPCKAHVPCGAKAVTYLYDAISYQDQKNRAQCFYYTFGWSGLLSQKNRYLDATLFYESLSKELNKLTRELGVTPTLKLIAFSHGGNICLNLARVKDQEKKSQQFQVNELILLGMPVQRETDFLVDDPMFEKVYHFYSGDDMVQTSDFFSLRRFFSNRKFHKRRSFTISKKVTQINIKVMKYIPRKGSINEPDLMKTPLPRNYKRTKIKKIEMSPGHMELWYIGWTPTGYRKTFPLFPVPVIGYASYLVDLIKQQTWLNNDIELTLHPQREIIEIRNKRTKHKKTLPFVSTALIDQLDKDLEHYKPTDEFMQEYNRRTKTALTFARASKNGALIYETRETGSRTKKTERPTCLDYE